MIGPRAIGVMCAAVTLFLGQAPPPPPGLLFRPGSRPSTVTPAVPAREWATVDPAAVGWSAERLAAAGALASTSGSAAIVVVDNGTVIWTWGGVSTPRALHSVRKSILSALIGVAIERGQIDPSATLAALGIDDTPPELSPPEKQATVRDLLAARSGVYHPAVYETAGMAAQRPARGSHAPGSFWYYNNWDFNVLGSIFEQQTKGSIFKAFRNDIAAPLGMQDYTDADGEYFRGAESRHPAYLFRLSARDLARFGLLYLNRGAFGERHVVPARWVEESTRSHSDAGLPGGYGYLWWTASSGKEHYPFVVLPDGSFSARGTGEQHLVVIPALRLVIVHLTDTEHGPSAMRVTQFARILRTILEARQ
jgi:CubicO group peptidase (beta-lactamase class C family)